MSLWKRKNFPESTINSPQDFQSILDYIAQAIKKNNLRLWGGAGISFHSDAPIVWDINQALWEALEASEEEKQVLNVSKVPFEIQMQVLRERTQIAPIMGIFTGLTPNHNHIFAAKLARKGMLSIFVTTNFDELTEQAYKNEGMVEGKDFIVLRNKKDFEKEEWKKSKKPVIIKIHGCQSDQENMIMYMDKMTAEALYESRARVTQHVFGNHTNWFTKLFKRKEKPCVLTMGYSYSDVESISRILKKSEIGTSVIDIAHSQDITPRVEIINQRENNNPFYRRKQVEGKRIYIETSVMLNALWDTVLTSEERANIESQGRARKWLPKLKEWKEENFPDTLEGKANRSFVLGELLSRNNDIEKGKQRFEEVLLLLNPIQEKTKMMLSLLTKAYIYLKIIRNKQKTDIVRNLSAVKEKGDKDSKILELLENAKKYAESSKDPQLLAEAYIHIVEEKLMYQDDTAQEFEQLEILFTNNPSINDHERAYYDYYQILHLLSLRRENKQTETFSAIERKIEERLEQVRRKGLKQFEIMYLNLHVHLLINFKGTPTFNSEGFEKSKEILHNALEIANNLYNQEAIAISTLNLSKVEFLSGNISKAIKYSAQSLVISLEENFHNHILENLLHIIKIYESAQRDIPQDNRDSQEYIQQILVTAKTLLEDIQKAEEKDSFETGIYHLVSLITEEN